MILIAAAPGEKLPNFPLPMHCFSSTAIHSVKIDGIRYECNVQNIDQGAPLRTVTIYDAIGDLPIINDGINFYNRQDILVKPKEVNKNTSYKIFLKNGIKVPVADHVCKETKLLIYERISHIPVRTGSDWRDLPNISFMLKDKTKIEKLKYLNETKDVCNCNSSKYFY